MELIFVKNPILYRKVSTSSLFYRFMFYEETHFQIQSYISATQTPNFNKKLNEDFEHCAHMSGDEVRDVH